MIIKTAPPRPPPAERTAQDLQQQRRASSPHWPPAQNAPKAARPPAGAAPLAFFITCAYLSPISIAFTYVLCSASSPAAPLPLWRQRESPGPTTGHRAISPHSPIHCGTGLFSLTREKSPSATGGGKGGIIGGIGGLGGRGPSRGTSGGGSQLIPDGLNDPGVDALACGLGCCFQLLRCEPIRPIRPRSNRILSVRLRFIPCPAWRVLSVSRCFVYWHHVTFFRCYYTL